MLGKKHHIALLLTPAYYLGMSRLANEATPKEKAEKTKGRGAAFISSLFRNNPEEQQYVLTVQNRSRLPSTKALAEVIVQTMSTLNDSLYLDLDETYRTNLCSNDYGYGNGGRKMFNPHCHYLVIGRRIAGEVVPLPTAETSILISEDLAA